MRPLFKINSPSAGTWQSWDLCNSKICDQETTETPEGPFHLFWGFHHCIFSWKFICGNCRGLVLLIFSHGLKALAFKDGVKFFESGWIPRGRHGFGEEGGNKMSSIK